ncbi:hypothetical protein [Leptothoe spongobia]|uniref:Peptidase C-terminal archaeal/bacterial domain-containing protein n=1 Tax=Leptothoe spongobia TAU-MAC 1115 TaxID=1967444 RepID=A0A947GJY3_9CYAN|nr:hypothetical protein [Leptothoe spongobia]MBT9316899.1 hypothetical protein [Leptothoe spongobia TAU-MAC 1115]
MIVTSSGIETSPQTNVQPLSTPQTISTVDLGVIHDEYLGEDLVTEVNQYSFSTHKRGGLLISLRERPSLKNTDNRVKFTLFRNSSRNGVVTEADMIAESQLADLGNFGKAHYLELPGLGRGNYLLRIEQVEPGQTNYEFKIGVAQGEKFFYIGANSLITANQLDNDGRVWLNGYRALQGDFYGNDAEQPIHFVRFQLKNTSYFTASSRDFNCEVELSLLSSEGEMLLQAQPQDDAQFMYSDCLAPGTYYIKVTQTRGKISDSYEPNYRIDLSADPVTQAELMVMVKHIHAMDDFDSADQSQADFYPRVTIDGVSYEQETVLNTDNVATYYKVSEKVDLNKTQIPITLSIYDADEGNDDQADINPRQGVKDLNLFYNAMTGQVTSPDLNVYQEGTDIVVQGQDEGHQARVIFQVIYHSFYR